MAAYSISWGMAAMMCNVVVAAAAVVIIRTRPRVIAASHFCHEKSDLRVSVSMGLRLADLRAVEAPLKFQI